MHGPTQLSDLFQSESVICTSRLVYIFNEEMSETGINRKTKVKISFLSSSAIGVKKFVLTQLDS